MPLVTPSQVLVLARYIDIVSIYAMRYTWTDEKSRDNLRRHHIAFEDAIQIFEGPTVERVDDRFDYGEVRVYAIGLVNGLEMTVIYTERDDDERRIISAWRAEPHERRYYWQNLEGLKG